MSVVDRRLERLPDRRVRRSRASIVAAFNQLILERGYAGLTPSAVAEAADVGRSTFYEHFSGLDDLLAKVRLGPILGALATGCFESAMPPQALGVIEHLWENRRLARALLRGDAHAVVLRAFAEEFTSAIGTRTTTSDVLLEPELIGLYLAAAQRLVVLEAWLSGRSARSADQIARALHASGRATLIAMTGQVISGEG